MDASLNIVYLIENNPVTKLSRNYNNKLITRIKENFTETQQQLFVSSFYCYLNYNQTTDFVVDLDNIWQWLGFHQKYEAKRSLEKNFVIDKDYKILLRRLAEQKDDSRGGHNKQTILLNLSTFKLFCIKAGTQKSDEIHKYFVKLEELLHIVVQEECDELRLQIENHISSSQLEKELLREKTILEQYSTNTQCVYYGIIDNLSNNGEKLIKFGNSNDLPERVSRHKKTYTNFRLVNAFQVDNKLYIENAMKMNDELKPLRRAIEINSVNCTELLAIDNLPLDKLDNIIKNIITKIEYNPDNYTKLLNENKVLKEEIAALKRDNNKTFLLEENKKLRKIKEEYNTLVKTTLKKITKENYRIKVEYENLLKRVNKSENKSETTPIISNVIVCETSPTTENKDDADTSDNVDDGQPHMLNENRRILRKFQKLPDGFYYINGEKFSKLNGTRQEVWDRVAYKTEGGLLMSQLKLNNVGDIVSLKKSIYSKENLKDICRPKNKQK